MDQIGVAFSPGDYFLQHVLDLLIVDYALGKTDFSGIEMVGEAENDKVQYIEPVHSAKLSVKFDVVFAHGFVFQSDQVFFAIVLVKQKPVKELIIRVLVAGCGGILYVVLDKLWRKD